MIDQKSLAVKQFMSLPKSHKILICAAFEINLLDELSEAVALMKLLKLKGGPKENFYMILNLMLAGLKEHDMAEQTHIADAVAQANRERAELDEQEHEFNPCAHCECEAACETPPEQETFPHQAGFDKVLLEVNDSAAMMQIPHNSQGVIKYEFGNLMISVERKQKYANWHEES